MRHTALFLGLLVAAAASPAARAAPTTVSYGGVVSQVRAATSGPAGPADIQVGTPVTFSATFDLATAVNRSQTFFNIDGISGLPVALPGLRTVSLFDDPSASYTVTIGSHVFTQADDDLGGDDFGLGAGRFPLVVYNGTQLLGLDGEGVVDGLAFAFDPLAYLLHYSRSVGSGYLEADGDYGFRVSTSLDAAIAAAAVAAVPEPTTWALTLAGIGLVGVNARRRRRER